jgi:transcription elongation factor GreA
MRPVMPADHQPEDVPLGLGCRVRLRDVHGEDEYVLVPRAVADPLQGLLSEESPVGRAILGHRRGEEIEVMMPDGLRRLTIAEVTPGGVSWDGGGSSTCAP